MKSFESVFKAHGAVALPGFSGTRIMMMPVRLGDMSTLPDTLGPYKDVIAALFSLQDYDGETGYITIDEKSILPGEAHRRAGKHVDGIYRSTAGSWGGGGGWAGGGKPAPKKGPRPAINPSSAHGTGMLTVSSHAGCKAWNQSFSGWPGDEGECEHLASQCREDAAKVFEAGCIYWADPLCVHESLLMTETVQRQFIRLSLPSTAPWFEGYTANPLGIMLSGPVLERRAFMDM